MQNVENTFKKSVTQGANLVRGSATLGANVVRAGARGSVVVAKGGVTGLARGVTSTAKGVTSTVTSTAKGVTSTVTSTANIVTKGVTNTVSSTVASSAHQLRRGSNMIFRSKSRSDSDSDEDSEYDSDARSEGGTPLKTSRRSRRRHHSRGRSGDASVVSKKDRPSYKLGGDGGAYNPDGSDIDEEDESESHSMFSGGNQYQNYHSNLLKAKNIEGSAGTHRLQRILKQSGVLLGDDYDDADVDLANKDDPNSDPIDLLLEQRAAMQRHRTAERIPDAKNPTQVAKFVSRVVLPPFKVDLLGLGGEQVLERGYPQDIMQQEVLLCMRCHDFESTGAENVWMTCLQHPNEYAKHKRSLGIFLSAATPSTTAKSHKLQYVLVGRSTTKPLLDPPLRPRRHHNRRSNHNHHRRRSSQTQQRRASASGNAAAPGASPHDASERGGGGDYDAMFGSGVADMGLDDSLSGSVATDERHTVSKHHDHNTDDLQPDPSPLVDPDHTSRDDDEDDDGALDDNGEEDDDVDDDEDNDDDEEELGPEIASFPVLVCMFLNADGTAPDIRKLVPLMNLTAIQDLHATVVQLAFDNGDTIRIDFGGDEALARLDKERFLWSLLQIHAVLCLGVLERTPHAARHLLAPVHVRNLDRAELQYVATVNKFLSKSPILCALLDRQREFYRAQEQENDEAGVDALDGPERGAGGVATASADVPPSKLEEERDNLAYDLIMGNVSLRVTLYTEEERKDAEEILNAIPWGDERSAGEADAASGPANSGVAERLALWLHMRLRDLEAETCRRLIAWEDEKHLSARQTKLFAAADDRDTVDALALASLFKTLESLDTELQSMEEWLQERAAAIKPLTDDCADIEEENRQLEQQWKSYDMLGSEMKRLLLGMEIEDPVLRILRNPASALVYDEDGRVDVDESESGVEEIYQAGRVLQEAMEFPRLSGGLHLDAVNERADGLGTVANTFCTNLAHIIVTVMEQFNEEVLAGSDHGKVSKSDTHSMIAKKIRDTQRKFQSALLGYIKLIEILAALNPDLLPGLRDAYSEMVAESILMKKRMKGYFQALPGKNAAYMSKAGKDLKDYVPFSEDEVLELVNAPDMRAALSELLPVIAREAYFTSALFGAATKEQDGREKKRNFESTRKAVDNASQHFRYYIERTCGILPDQIGGKTTIEGGVKGDPLLCLVGSIYLNESMDNYIDREKKGGDHSLSLAYVRATILDLRKKADKQWVGWVDRQIEWIRSHDGVPLTGKRAGIFPSFARFPCYLDHLLLACSEGREEGYVPDIVHIKVINYYLQKIAATQLESLKECSARETTDQQYAANVMQMENTYFFTQSLKQRHEIFSELFAKQMTKANAICKESTDAYLGWMIKREFTSLHELFSKVSKLRKEVGDKQVPNQVPKQQFVRTLQKEANRDAMKEKIGTLYSRMEKHLSEEGTLLPIAWKALVKVLYEWFGRWEKLCTHIYGHTLNPSAVDIVRIAKAAGGDAKPKQGSSSDFAFKSILALGNKQSP